MLDEDDQSWMDLTETKGAMHGSNVVKGNSLELCCH